MDFSDMVSLLSDDFVREGYRVSNLYEEEPYLPIDLYCTRSRGKTQEHCFVLVASINHITDEFQRKLLFYLYYLSYDYKPSEYKIILAIPASASVERIPYYADTAEDRSKDFYKENGFGLWRVSEKDIDKETCNAITLWDRISRDVINNIARRDRRLLRIKDAIINFVDKYIHDSVLGIRGEKISGLIPIQFEESHIDARLLHRILKLDRISYKGYLFEAISEHLSYKGSEYELVTKVFSKLWEDWIGVSYIDFLEIFDPALQHVFAETKEASKGVYRDHYIHQFQVFLSGLYIIDNLYDDFARRYSKPEICWLITSSFHDMAYPVQLYDEWSDEFFEKVFNIKQMGGLELKSKFVDQSFLTCMGYLLARLCSLTTGGEVSGNWFAQKNGLVQCFYKEITEPKNHCILSSISLLKMIQEKASNLNQIAGLEYEDALNNIFIPSALAIALHDHALWGKLKDEKEWGRLGEECPLPLLKYETDALTFLLVFCDNIQEWGRPSKSKTAYKEEIKQLFYLKDFTYDTANSFTVTLWTPNHKRTEQFFVDKETELKEVSTFLQQPFNVCFNIRLEDEDGNGETLPMSGTL